MQWYLADCANGRMIRSSASDSVSVSILKYFLIMCSCSSTLCKLSYGRRRRRRSNRKTRNGGWTTLQDCAPCKGQVSVQSQRNILTLHRRAHVSLRAEQWQQERLYRKIWWLHIRTKVKWFDHMRGVFLCGYACNQAEEEGPEESVLATHPT